MEAGDWPGGIKKGHRKRILSGAKSAVQAAKAAEQAAKAAAHGAVQGPAHARPTLTAAPLAAEYTEISAQWTVRDWLVSLSPHLSATIASALLPAPANEERATDDFMRVTANDKLLRPPANDEPAEDELLRAPASDELASFCRLSPGDLEGRLEAAGLSGLAAIIKTYAARLQAMPPPASA